jgi:hypothetical protein
MKRTSPLRTCAVAGCALILVTGAAATLLIVGATLLTLRTTPRVVSGITPAAPPGEGYPRSAQQQAVAAERGAPESFAILFYQEDLDDGSIGDVRYETWSYYASGEEITFINGEQVSTRPIDSLGLTAFPTPYLPAQFTAYMSLEEVVNAAQLASFTVVPLESSLLPRGQTFFAAELTFGMVNGQLRYVESLPLAGEG